MPYSELLVAPMRSALADAGFRELRTAGEVDDFMAQIRNGTALIAVNSVCGCSSGTLRPAVLEAVGGQPRPSHLATVFAGQDLEATVRAREYFAPYPPSSPAVALFREGELVFMMLRQEIQGRSPREVAASLRGAFETHCSDVEAA